MQFLLNTWYNKLTVAWFRFIDQPLCLFVCLTIVFHGSTSLFFPGSFLILLIEEANLHTNIAGFFIMRVVLFFCLFFDQVTFFLFYSKPWWVQNFIEQCAFDMQKDLLFTHWPEEAKSKLNNQQPL